jgi:hypothetical protein
MKFHRTVSEKDSCAFFEDVHDPYSKERLEERFQQLRKYLYAEAKAKASAMEADRRKRSESFFPGLWDNKRFL